MLVFRKYNKILIKKHSFCLLTLFIFGFLFSFQTNKKNKSISKDQYFLSTIKELKENKKLKLSDIYTITGLVIKQIDESNETFDIIYLHDTTNKFFFTKGEIRQNKKSEMINTSLLILTLNLKNCFSRKYIVENFGFPRPIPSPHGQLKNKTEYYRYEGSEVNVSFEFPYRKDECLLSVIFNWNP